MGNFFLRLALPLHARMTVLWRWRWISASSWFQSLSCSAPLMSRPSSWICCILERHKQRVGPSINSCCWQTSLAHPQAWGHLLVCFWHIRRRTDHQTCDVAKSSFLDWGQSVVFWRKTHTGCHVAVLENRDGLPSSCKTRTTLTWKIKLLYSKTKNKMDLVKLYSKTKGSNTEGRALWLQWQSPRTLFNHATHCGWAICADSLTPSLQPLRGCVQLPASTSVCTLKSPTQAAIPLSACTQILHTLLGMGSAALAAAVSTLVRRATMNCLKREEKRKIFSTDQWPAIRGKSHTTSFFQNKWSNWFTNYLLHSLSPNANAAHPCFTLAEHRLLVYETQAPPTYNIHSQKQNKNRKLLVYHFFSAKCFTSFITLYSTTCPCHRQPMHMALWNCIKYFL